MHPQLEPILADFVAATERLNRLAHAVPADQWPVRTESDRWSISECVGHLNLTSRANAPLLQNALVEGRNAGHGRSGERYRRDPMGWILWRTMGPPVRIRTRTVPAFVPDAAKPAVELVSEFHHLQQQQIACLEAADGLPLNDLWIPSAFDPRVKYNLYAALSILPRHQHRHLWQAEQLHGIPAG